MFLNLIGVNSLLYLPKICATTRPIITHGKIEIDNSQTLGKFGSGAFIAAKGLIKPNGTTIEAKIIIPLAINLAGSLRSHKPTKIGSKKSKAKIYL